MYSFLRQKKRRNKRIQVRYFTIIEMLVVIGIILVLYVTAKPAFDSIALGTNVDRAASVVSTQLRLARQHAVTNRVKTAVVLPGQNYGEAVRQYTQVGVFREDNSTYKMVPDNQWEEVPTGAAIIDVDDTDNKADQINSQPSPSSETVSSINYDGNSYNDVRAVIFSPDGSLSSDHSSGLYITVIEWTVKNDGSLVPSGSPKNKKNWKDIHVNKYTGRISVNSPGSS